MNVHHDRLHALDGLRASMMLLGLVLHTAVSYTVTDLGSAWPYKDPHTSQTADFAVRFIHLFRMPIFFVLAGFFAALMHFRRGSGGFVRNRLVRIGVPFVVGLLVLYPFVVLGFVFAEGALDGSRRAAAALVRELASQPLLYLPDSTLHLWFLYYLLLLYGVALLCNAVFGRQPRTRSFLARSFRRMVFNPFARVLVLTAISALTLAPMRGVLNTDTGFIVDPFVFCAYAVFFGFGWLLYAQRDVLPTLRYGAMLQVVLALVLFMGLELVVTPKLEAISDWRHIHIVRDIVDALLVWLLFFGLTGLFLRYFNQPSPRTRYIVDASYWVYLVHMPCAIWMAGLLAPTNLNVWARIGIVLVTITAIGFGSYALFVRHTFIGRILNGPRPAEK